MDSGDGLQGAIPFAAGLDRISVCISSVADRYGIDLPPPSSPGEEPPPPSSPGE
jgi:hypothetical protein